MRGTRGRLRIANAIEEAEREQVGERDRARARDLQCTFSNVQTKSVARKKKLGDALSIAKRRSRRSSRSASSSTRVRRETFSRHSSERTALWRSPARQRSRSAVSSRAIPSTSSGATTTPAPVSRRSCAAAPSGGTSARIGRSAARYSKTFPESTPRPRPVGLRDQQQQRLGVALQLERAAVRRVRDQLDPVGDARSPTRGRSSGSRRRSAQPRRRPGRAPSGTASGRACRRTSRRA